MPRITKRLVDSLKATGAEYIAWDDALPGFGVRVRSSGAKSYVFVYRTPGGRKGRLQRLTIGPAEQTAASPLGFRKRRSVWTADQARKEAERHNGDVKARKDPAAEKRAKRADLTVAALVDRYLQDGPASRPGKKLSSWGSDTSNLRRHAVPLLGRRPLQTLTRADVEKFQADVTAGKTKAPATAKGAKRRGRVRVSGGNAAGARATAALRAMLSWAVEQGHLAENPAKGIRLNRVQGRERFLSDAELASLGDAALAMENEGFNPASLTIARLLLLTGARRNEIAGLRRGYVDAERSVLRLPDSKTGAKVIPLGSPALMLLADWLERDRDAPASAYVFPGARGKGHHVGFAKVWRELRKRAGLEGVRLHDLRHTHASVGVALNQSLYVVGRILGHSKPETTARYSHLALDPVRAAADQTAKRLADAMRSGGATVPNVLPLKGPKAR